MRGLGRVTKELKTNAISAAAEKTTVSCFVESVWRLFQRADYLYAYNHRRFTTVDNGNEHITFMPTTTVGLQQRTTAMSTLPDPCRLVIPRA